MRRELGTALYELEKGTVTTARDKPSPPLSVASVVATRMSPNPGRQGTPSAQQRAGTSATNSSMTSPSRTVQPGVVRQFSAPSPMPNVFRQQLAQSLAAPAGAVMMQDRGAAK